MKITLHTKKLKFILLLLAVVMVEMAWGIVIVNFPLESGNTALEYSTGNSACLLTETATFGPSYDTNTGATVSGWNGTVGKHWKTSVFNTTGYVTITLSAQVKSSATGPRDFKLQYSLNGTTFIDVINLPSMTATMTGTGTLALPAACANQSTVYIRFTTYSLLKLDGTSMGSTSSGTSSIKGLVISGEEPARPTTQSSAVSLIAITPTSIKIGCTSGTGDHRIIVMNTTNTFTDPADDFNPASGTVSENYTSGQQIVYNGTGTIQTVYVSSSSNEYWFRVYDYNYNDGMFRYIISEASSNPKKCLLETCILPTHTNIGLITATLGGTITDPPTGPTNSITSRGIYWSDVTGVSVNDNKVYEAANTTGIFTINITNTNGLARSTRIYYKAFVENLSGKSFSEESYFDNIPIFTGTGTWETQSLWNVNEIPGSVTNKDGSEEDSPIIDGDCTLTATNSCNVLTITTGNKLTIQPEKSLTVVGDLINEAGTSGLVIKASSTLANGSLIFPQDLTTVPATVEMYSKASWNASLLNTDNSKYKWQYFGIPVASLPANPTFYGGYVRYWEETGTAIDNHWLPMTTSSTLNPFTGYEICQLNPKTYSFTGDLVNTDFSQIDLAYTTTPVALYPGQHIFSNPYTAAINISSLAGAFGSNMEEAVYLYNAGTYSQWEATSGATTNDSITTTPGQYTVSTPMSAGRANTGVPTQIPSMQAFLVKAKPGADFTNNTLNFSYNSVVGINTELQRARSTQSTIATRIDIRSTHFADKMWIFTDSTCTNKYDRGWDGKKLFGSPRTPQIFAMEPDGNYQINAVADMNNTDLGFITGEEKEFTIKFTHENVDKQYSSIYLYDLVAKTTTDITLSGSEYKFTAEPNTKVVKRFKIISSNLNETSNDESQLKIYSADGLIMIQNNGTENGELKIYDMSGRFIQQATFGANNTTAVFKNLSPGVYLAKTISNSKELTKTFLVR